jgi:hypothetical protein
VTTAPRHVVALIALVLLAGVSAPAAAKPAPAVTSAPARTGKADATGRLESRHAQLLWRHRPDLAERYAAAPWSVRFAGLDEATLADHVRDLRQLLAAADSLPASERTDTLRVRLRRELADCAPDGALRRDALLWLDIVAAAARAPFASGPAGGCDRTRRSALQLRALPEALRSATVLMRGSIAPDPAAFEQRLGAVERLLRDDLPARTDACKESRRRAEFVEADSLAAASLADFRSWLVSGR